MDITAVEVVGNVDFTGRARRGAFEPPRDPAYLDSGNPVQPSPATG